jgi:hypothetical protein
MSSRCRQRCRHRCVYIERVGVDFLPGRLFAPSLKATPCLIPHRSTHFFSTRGSTSQLKSPASALILYEAQTSLLVPQEAPPCRCSFIRCLVFRGTQCWTAYSGEDDNLTLSALEAVHGVHIQPASNVVTQRRCQSASEGETWACASSLAIPSGGLLVEPRLQRYASFHTRTRRAACGATQSCRSYTVAAVLSQPGH